MSSMVPYLLHEFNSQMAHGIVIYLVKCAVEYSIIMNYILVVNFLLRHEILKSYEIKCNSDIDGGLVYLLTF